MLSIAWSTDSKRLAGASYDGWIWNREQEWKARSVDTDVGLYDVAWSPDPHSKTLVFGSAQLIVEVYDGGSLKRQSDLEGHAAHVRRLAFSSDGTILASADDEGKVLLWRTGEWKLLSSIQLKSIEVLSFRPEHFQFAASDSASRVVQLWEVDQQKLEREAEASSTISYKSAKIVLVGDSGVGKTGLGWTIAHGTFKEHSSTHGQQFWVVDRLSAHRSEVQHEAVLWDLAGQPDYRLIHALFLDDADAALILFDPTHATAPLAGPQFWIKQLRGCRSDPDDDEPLKPPAVLVGARADRGIARLTDDELASFCRTMGLERFFYTSAKTGEGIDDLISWLGTAIRWDEKPATITTSAFKKIKDLVLGLKEQIGSDRKVILKLDELKSILYARGPREKTGDEQVRSAVFHLSNHGYVSLLSTSKGGLRVLLVPELLNNLAASFILEARRNRKGLGSLAEKALQAGRYDFPEVRGLSEPDRDIMVDSTAAMFLAHNICFRETDPLTSESYLIFPELINLGRPTETDVEAVGDDVSYIISGSVENVYASLVVLLGYTSTFTRTNQWRNQARYEVGDGLVCGFRMETEAPAEITLVLYFGTNVGVPVRTLFRSLVESFLSRHEVSVRRIEPVECVNGHLLNRIVVRELMESGSHSAFCSRCGSSVHLPDSKAPTQLNVAEAETVRTQSRTADMRSRLESTLFRLSAFAAEEKRLGVKCFISYAWGDAQQERWVERQLATDLSKAGIEVILDRWHNSQIGSSVPRFVELVASADCVVVVGTPSYREKYQNLRDSHGYVVAAEGDLIGMRMIGTEMLKKSVFPALLSGTDSISFPDLLRGRVYADFTNSGLYFSELLGLALSIYQIPVRDPLATELRDSLEAPFVRA